MTIDARVEMFHSSTWNTITSDVDMDAGIAIGSGQPDEHSESNPTSCALTLEDRAGTYRGLDPESSLYGLIGHGTPFRVRIGAAQPRLMLNGVGGVLVAGGGVEGWSGASTPDHASLDITGDIDIRMELQPPTWRPLLRIVLAGKYYDLSNQRSWALRLLEDGKLNLSWTTDGTSGTRVTRTSTAAIPDDGERRAIRVTLDVNNGAAGHDVTFYTSTSIGGSWTQLGSTVTTAGTTSIFASTADLTVGTYNFGTVEFSNEVQLSGSVFAFEVRNGIAGTVVANPDFTTREPGDTSFADSAGRTWTVHASASIVDVSLRSYTEAISWTPQTDETTLDISQAVDSRGTLEHLGGDEPLRSTLYRVTVALVEANEPVAAYWPCEDGVNATQIASAIDGVSPMSITAVSPAEFAGFACSAPIPALTGASEWTGIIPAHVGTDIQVRMLMHLPQAGVAVEQGLFILYTSGTAAQWNFNVLPAGTLRLLAYDTAGTNILDSGVLTLNGTAGNDQLARLQLSLDQNGSDVDWAVDTYIQDAAVVGGNAGTLTGRTCGSAQRIVLSPGGGLDGVAVGHITIQPTITDLFDVADELNAFNGETAGRRIQRLCDEESIAFEHVGDLDATPPMGRQVPGQLMDLIEECWTADHGGGVYEPRRNALGYRTYESLCNQDPALELDMTDGVIVNPFAPPLDATRIVNDVTVTRRDGSSARAVLETGPASVASVGRRKDAVTLNIQGDDQLADQAHWRLHVGTVLGHRVAVLEVEMEHHPELQQSVLELRQGDLIRLTNPTPGLPPGPIDLLALGWNDTITDQTWRWTCHLAPGSPYQVLQLDTTGYGRLDTEGSVLAEAIDADDTTLKVATTSGPPWTTEAGDMPMPVRIGGEKITISAVADTVFTFVGAGSTVHGDNATLNPPLPAGLQAKDVLLLRGRIRNYGGNVDSPGVGWVAIADEGYDKIFAKVAGSSEPTPSVSFNGVTGNTTSAQVCAFRPSASGGVHDLTKLVINTARGRNASQQDIPYPGIKVLYPNSVILYVGGKRDDWTSVTSPGTEIGDSSSTLGNDQGIVWSYEIQTTPTSIQAGSFTVTGGAAEESDGWVVVFRSDLQTFTVSARSANGVVKSHAVGAAVEIDDSESVVLALGQG